MTEPRPTAPEPETRGQKIARQIFWIVCAIAIIGAFGSLFIHR